MIMGISGMHMRIIKSSAALLLLSSTALYAGQSTVQVTQGTGTFFQTTTNSIGLNLSNFVICDQSAGALCAGVTSSNRLMVDPSGTTIGISGTLPAFASTPLMNAAQSGTWSVTANAGTNLNTSALALESGGNLAAIAATVSGGAIGSNIAQVNGVTILAGAGATGTGSQRATVAQDTSTIAGSAPGTAGSPSTQVVSVQGVASGTVVPVAIGASSNVIGKVGIDQTTPGTTNLVQIGGSLPAFAATPAFNQSQVNGVTISTGNGVAGTGVQRVTIASDNTAFSVNATVAGPLGTATSTAASVSTVVNNGISGTTAGGATPSGSNVVVVQGDPSGTKIPVAATTQVLVSALTGLTSAATITNTSAQVVAAASRQFLVIDNESTTATIACNFGGTAAINTAGSFTIPPGSTRTWASYPVPADTVNCISSVASSPATIEVH